MRSAPRLADPGLVAADAPAQLGAEAEVARRMELDEAAGLDGEADIADRGADIVLVALVLEADGGAEIDDAVAAEQAEAGAVVAAPRTASARPGGEGRRSAWG